MPGGIAGGGIDGLPFDGPGRLGATIGCVGVPGWPIFADISWLGDELPRGVKGAGVDPFDSPVSRLLCTLGESPAASSGRSRLS
jgi:hypothetical protein